MTWTPSVNTLYRNIEVLAATHCPRSHQLRLGPRWGFGLPTGEVTGLTEYSFPLHPDGDLPGLLRRRGGLVIGCHDDPSGDALHEHLRDTGEPAVVVVDSYHLPYRPAFGQVHSSRTIIVAPARDGHVLVDDCWEPTFRGLLRRDDLDAARRSVAAADPALEPVFSGVAGPAQWFTVAAEEVPVPDPRRWACQLVDELVADITTTRHAAGARFGLDALRELVELLAVGGDAPWRVLSRRDLAVVLRAELSSRRYLCVLLRAAARLADRPGLAADVDRYQEGLRHFQAARDTQLKTVRAARPGYDAHVADRCRDALANEERLLAAVVAARLTPTEEVDRPWLASH
ncbi:MAG: hypothetical protein HOV94_26620 [Saccharothrix sp.]|nr:hypothetical protein [Saccharothrix sp.]